MNCRVCANTPFQSIFGDADSIDSDGEVAKADDILSGQEHTHVVGGSVDDAGSEASGYDPLRFLARSDEEIKAKVIEWRPFLHPRTKELWKEREDVDQMLGNVVLFV